LTRRQLQGDAWRTLFRRVHVHHDVPDTLEVRAKGILLIAPKGAVASGRTAAWLLGADVLHPKEVLVPELTLPRDTPMSPRPDLVIRRALLTDDDIAHVGGVEVTRAVRTAFDLARRKGFMEAMTGVDALMHVGAVTADEVLAYAAERPGWRGVRQVPRVLDLADPRTESPMESRLRFVIVVVGGLPRPDVQIWVCDENGYGYARIDMGYEERRLGIEFDGKEHAKQWQADLERERRLRVQGWEIVRFVAADVYHRQPFIVSTVRQFLTRAA
jgi:hypothetical protein